MAVTTTYAFQNLTGIAIPDHSGGGDLEINDMAGLADGGVAAVGFHSASGGHTDYAIFNGPRVSGPDLGGEYDGSLSAVDQLTSGDIVVASSDGIDLFYSIVGGDESVSLEASATTSPDVAALNSGGFVVVGQFLFGGSDHDINVYLRDADGGEAAPMFTIDATTANDQKPTVCALRDGGFAVAWQREQAGGETEVWYAVYEDNGTVRKFPSLLDLTGAVNEDVTAVALDDGGFGLVYEDSQWADGIGLTYARLNSAGAIKDETDVRPGLGEDEGTRDPAATLLSNGMLVVTYTLLTDSGADQQVFARLIEPKTGALLTPETLISDAGHLDDSHSAAAGYGDAGLMVGWDRTGSSDGAKAQLVRTSTGNAADDVVNGDDAVDVMFGAAGFDLLKGFDNNDNLDGGTGIDTLIGGRGNDILTGGRDPDLLSGAQGKDTFRYTSVLDTKKNQFDAITDIAGKDVIDLALIDANVNKPGDQKFDLVAAFTGKAGQLVLTFHTTGDQMGNTTVEMDVDGDALTDAMIVLNGDHDDFTRFAL